MNEGAGPRRANIDPLEHASRHFGGANKAAYLVGGRLRDRLLGRSSLDTDIAVPKGALEAAREIARVSGGAFVVLDESREIGRVVWTDPAGPSKVLDIARFAGDSETIESDLRLRDFGINALALPLDASSTERIENGGDALRSALIDPVGGLSDIDIRSIRMTAEQALDDDPLRLLRAARLASELDFHLEPETMAAIRVRAPHAARPAGERSREELLKLLATDDDAWDVHRLSELGLMRALLPEVAETEGVEQSAPHDRDVYRHSLAVVAGVGRIESWLGETADIDWKAVKEASVEEGAVDLYSVPDTAGGPIRFQRRWLKPLAMIALQGTGASSPKAAAAQPIGGFPRIAWRRFAALLHDIGKPMSRRSGASVGAAGFKGHAVRGAEMVEGVADRLKLSNEERDYLGVMVKRHMRPLHLAVSGGAGGREAFRFYRAAGTAGVDIARMTLADNASKGPLAPGFSQALADVSEALIRAWYLEHDTVVRPRLPLDGRELMDALSLDAGPEVGRLLAAIEEGVAAGELEGREAAIARARELLLS